MTLAEAWGQALALMLAWPPIGPTEVTVYLAFGMPAVRWARSLVRT
jgi:hypothetical protein